MLSSLLSTIVPLAQLTSPLKLVIGLVIFAAGPAMALVTNI